MNRLLVAAGSAAGFAFTVWLFFPGYFTYDSRAVYGDMQAGTPGDWQSPVMGVLWRLVDPISPGPGSLFLVIAGLYWLGFGLLGLGLVRRSPWLGLLAPAAGLLPSSFDLLSMIWRDLLLGGAWLVAAAGLYATRDSRWRIAMQVLAAVLVLFGVLLRPNAVAAAPLLLFYAAWPDSFRWRRALLLYLPAVFGCVLLIQTVYYGVIGARRDNPAHSLLVFDLGGISHFTGENQFPVTWTETENRLLLETCYDPVRWDNYWTIPPCDFVMQRLERPDDVVFGTPRLGEAWRAALLSHPLAWLRHRLTYWATFVAGSRNLVIETRDVRDPASTPLAASRPFQTFIDWHLLIERSPLFRPLLWLLLAAAAVALLWRRRETAQGAFVVATGGSGIFYVASFGLVGVAADFRYAFWCVLAGVAAALAAALGERKTQ
jgi:hypothetical protein